MHRIDRISDCCTFVGTNERDLEAAVFLDGRTQFWSGSSTSRLSDELAAAPAVARPARFIFHISFCGSTLLARAVAHVTDALVLKEPHALVDLADWQMAQLRARRPDDQLAASVDFVTGKLTSCVDRPVVIKPSNWVNSLLPLLCRDPAMIRPVFIGMERAAFLVAVLRGGRDRLAFTARLAVHLAGLFDGGDQRIAAAVAASTDPLTQTANLAVLAHHFQTRLFNQVRAGRWDNSPMLDFEQVTGDLARTTLQACAELDLVPDERRVWQLASLGKHDSKQPGRSFSSAERQDADDGIRATYRRQIEDALDWAGHALDDAAQPDWTTALTSGR